MGFWDIGLQEVRGNNGMRVIGYSHRIVVMRVTMSLRLESLKSYHRSLDRETPNPLPLPVT